ncbi:MAG: sigma-70 family RNA polymerase sigma factor [Chloroflexota bacterium]|nr:sigma-70 family RNA polymerase sigma factor [Chloroflexota bacterium]
MVEQNGVHMLLMQLKQGHEEVLDVLYPRYARVFYAYARHNRLSHEDAEDIVQTTFWRALDRIGSYDEVYGGGERWLWSICKNLVIDSLRGKTALELPAELLSGEESDPANYAERQENLLAFKYAWDALPEEDRAELRRGRGRGPGRKAWHQAVQRLRSICVRSTL